MRPIRTFEGTIDNTLDGYEIEFSLDDSPQGRAHLMSLMTDLYSDPEMAVIREYSTNAIDSHIEAGVTRPIEITTPNSLSPYLVIKDFGLGLNINDLEKVYSKYGASTKRDSDAVNGTLGLGGKSAITYAKQFSVVAIKDGIKSSIVVTRNLDGIGVMEVVDTRSTTEHNGVEIKIPVREDNNINSKIESFFYYWAPGTVLVDEREPSFLMSEDGHTKINDTTFIINNKTRQYNTRISHDIIVMGNVAYATKGKPFTEELSESAWHNHTVTFVPMGAISFPPNRESVSYTPRTEREIARLMAEMKASIATSVDKQLASAVSYPDAYRVWKSWGNVIGVKNLPEMTYKGHKFLRVVDKDHSFINIGAGRYNYRSQTSGNLNGHSGIVDMSTLLDDTTLIVTDYPNIGPPTGGSKRKVNQYLESHSNVSLVLFFDRIPGSPWTDNVPTIKWETISSIKIANGNGTRGGSGPIPVLVRQDSGQFVEMPVNQNEPIVYLSPADWSSVVYTVEHVVRSLPEVQIVQLGRNRWEKFVRENPSALAWNEYYPTEYNRVVKSRMTEDELFYADHDIDYRNEANDLAGSNDPTFARLDKVRKNGESNLIGAYNRVKVPTKDLGQEYPLLKYQNPGKNVTHKIKYINAIYKGE